MAEFENIMVKIRADVAGFTAGMRKVENTLTSVGDKVTRVGMNLSKYSLAAGLAGGAAVKMSGNFEGAMNKVGALTNTLDGPARKAFEGLKDQAKELGASTMFSASQAADAMGFLAMSGMKASEIYEAMPQTLNLAAAANMELASTADLVTNVMKGMQIEMSELPHVSDVLVKAFTSSNTNLEQLGQAMKFVGPVAGAFGISIEETTAALGTLSNAGMQASMAGTGFRRVLSKLSTEGEALGIQVYDAAGKMRPFADMLEQLAEKGFTAEEAMDIFGERGGPAFINLMQAGAENIRGFTKELTAAEGATDRMAKVTMMGFNGMMKELKSSIEAVAIEIGESGLLQALTMLGKDIAGFFRDLAQTNPAILRMAAAFTAVIAVAGPLTIAIGAAVSVLGALAAPVGLLVAGLGALAAIGVEQTIAMNSGTKAMEKQRARVNMLVNALKSENTSQTTKVAILKELEKINPKIVDGIDSQNIHMARLVGNVQDYNDAMLKKIQLAVFEEELTQLYKDQTAALRELNKAEIAAANGPEAAKYGSAIGAQMDRGTVLADNLLEAQTAVKNSSLAIAELQKEAAQLGVELTGLGGPVKAVTNNLEDGTKAVDENAESVRGLISLYKTQVPKALESLEGIGMPDFMGAPKLDYYDQQMQKEGELAEHARYSTQYIAKSYQDMATGIKGAISRVTAATNEQFAPTIEMLKQKADSFRTMVAGGIVSGISQITQGLAMLATGGSSVKQFANQIFNLFGDFAIKMGTLGLTYSAFAQALQNTLAVPPLGIAASIGLIAAGAALKGAANAFFNTGGKTSGGATRTAPEGVPAFAAGGLVSGPTMALVGDNPGASYDPEVISPLSKLRDFMGGSQKVVVEGQLSNEVIYLAVKDYERKLNI